MGAGGWHLVGMTVRMRWNGQGSGDLPIKPGLSMKVTWVIRLPQEIKSGCLAWGQGAGLRSLLPRCPQRQKEGMGQKTWERGTRQSLTTSVGSEASQKTSGRSRMGVEVTHKLKVRLGEGSLDRKYVMMG